MLNKKKIFVVFVILFFAAGIFAQSFDNTEENSEVLPPEDEFALELEEESQQINDSLQDCFVVIESVQTHDLNPQTTSYSSDSQILTGLYEGLFTYDPRSLAPTYAIAIDYRISRDQKRWTFTINPKACFSNGEKITAADVRNSWLQLLSTPNAPYASLFDVISGAADFRNGLCSADKVGIYANSDESLSIHLVKPANYLPKVLCHSAFSVVNKNPEVYSGPFYLDTFELGYYRLKKNPYYWDSQNVPLKEIDFIQSDSSIENAYYFNIGFADWVSSNVDTDVLINKNAFSLNAEFATTYFFFKNNSEIWNIPEFRAALFEAIPWDYLREGYYVPATTYVYPIGNYPAVEGYSYTDVKEAENLMNAAREKYNIPQSKILPIILEIPENAFSSEKLAALSDAWAKLGVELQVKMKPTYEYFNSVKTSDSQLFIYTWVGDFADPLAFLELFRSDSTLNDSLWKNEEFDSLLNQAAEVSEEERYKLLSEAENLLLDNCMVIPIQHPVIYNIIDKNSVGGWFENAFDIHPLKYLYKKETKSTVPNIVMNK